MVELTNEMTAVNILLDIIGEMPVNHIEGSTNADVIRARRNIAEASRSIQVKGWHFNTNRNVTLTTADDGTISLPTNVLTFDATRPTDDYVVREGKVFDRINGSFDIGINVVADLTVLLDFENLPEPARQYITMVAGRRFSNRTAPDRLVYSFVKEDENEARATFMDWDISSADHNVLRDPAILRHLDRPIRRTR
jgi:hypothetical protein